MNISSIHYILNRKASQKKKTGPKRKFPKTNILNIKMTINTGVVDELRVIRVNIVKDLQLSIFLYDNAKTS